MSEDPWYLEHFDFADVLHQLDRSGAPDGLARRLAQAGLTLLNLDLEDLDRPLDLPEPLRDRLLDVCLPQAPSAQPRGLLASLRPTMALLLEVIAVRYERDEIAELLSAVHLLRESLPLLAWEPVLGHAGDPTQLLKTVQGSLWDQEACPSSGPPRRAAHELKEAVRTTSAWQHFMERSMSLLGAQLVECAGCQMRCAVRDLGDPALEQRLKLAAALSRSDLLGLRHGSTVGHAFAVPSRGELDQAWAHSRELLAHRDASIGDTDTYCLPGLPAFVTAVAGAALPTVPLLGEVRRQLREVQQA